ncbi:MAG TPA: prephenate dehydratase [Casimicrobiaceae bacterium]|nr:prephenate dehydratase [Casimicrobiaceae bacterium]
MSGDADGGGPPDEGIARHRAEIDRLDDAILAALAERARHAQAIGHLKAGAKGPAWRPERETQVLGRLTEANPGPLSGEHVAGIFRSIMAACMALEQKLRIAYLGPAGTFSHAAVARQFGEFVDAVPCATIDEVVRAAEAGQVDYAIVPVENSTEGAVGRTLDLACTTDLLICGEVKLRIRQNLMTRSPALAQVTKVYSHSQSLAQCVQWLARHLPGVPRVAVASNAEAARLASSEPGAAAIAGDLAARLYDVPVLCPHIEDEPNNTTRFWVLGRQQVPPSGRDETSLVMSAPNRPGAVYHLLEPLAKHGVSMTRFESRPSRTGLWEYLFFVDIAGHQRDPQVAAALAELAQRAPFLKLLGSYPAA